MAVIGTAVVVDVAAAVGMALREHTGCEHHPVV